MPELPFIAIIVSGALLLGGLTVALLGSRRQPVRLGDAFAHLDGFAGESAAAVTGVKLVDDASSRLERLGASVYAKSRMPLSDVTMQRLALAGRSIGDFYVEKLVLATLGLALPLLVMGTSAALGMPVSGMPAVIGLVGMVIGFFVPDLQLRRAASAQKLDATEALLTFFDLVTLERLANRSASQSVLAAAQLSDAPVFVRIRTTLEKARLQQRPPWNDLRDLAHELDLPALGDMADVLALDDQGAALADSLRARVRELRDAHLLKERIAAQQVSERMTIWMTIPVLIFALVFLAPPLLRLAVPA